MSPAGDAFSFSTSQVHLESPVRKLSLSLLFAKLITVSDHDPPSSIASESPIAVIITEAVLLQYRDSFIRSKLHESLELGVTFR